MTKRLDPSAKLPWSIASRLRPPATAVSAIPRPQLLARLDQVPPGGTAIIAAPAGYGKTTLLSQYFAHAPRSTWLTLARDDSDPSMFLHHLRYALDPSLDTKELSPASPFGLEARLQLATVLEPSADQANPTTVCIDEYDVVESPAVDELTAALIEQLPANLRLVICSRRPLSFPLAKLKAQRRVVEIDASQLRFESTEAEQLLGGVTDEDQTAIILSQTEGWPIALQLARIWLEMNGRSRDETIDVGGEVADIARYLAEQVLIGHPEDVQALLRDCSIVEEINVELVDWMRRRDDSLALLESLKALDPLLLAVTAPARTYRMHNLLKRILSQQLEHARSREEINALHGRAAHWYHRAGRLAEALRHAAQAGDSALAISIFEATGGPRSITHIGSAGIRALCATLPLGVFEESPRLQLVRCIALATGGYPAEAHRLFHDVKRELDRQEQTVALTTNMRIVEIYLAIYCDIEVPHESLEEIEALLEDMGKYEPEFRFFALLFLTIYYQQYGNLVAAERRVDELRRQGMTLHSPFTTLSSDAYGGLISYARGDMVMARHILQGALDRADSPTLRSSIYYIGSRIFLAEVLYEQNEIAAAEAHLQVFMPYIERGELWFDAYAAGFGIAARSACAFGSLEDAVLICERMCDLARQRGFLRLLRMGKAMRADLCCRMGRPDEAEDILHEFADVVAKGSLAHRDLRTWREYDVTASAIIRWTMGTGRHALAFDLCDEYEARGKREHRRRPVVKSRLFRAMLHQLRGDLEPALLALHEALEVGVPAGLHRTFLDEGEPMRRLVRRVMTTNFARRLTAEQRQHLRLLYGDCEAANDLVEANAAPIFSQREYDVLAELAQGKSNKLIGRRLNMTENTVKTHLKRIYAKLDVGDRADAVDRSRAIGVIS